MIEIIVVITIILILLAGMVKLGGVVRNSAMEKNTKTTISLLNTALQEYQTSRQGQTDLSFPPEPYQIWFVTGSGNFWDINYFEACWPTGIGIVFDFGTHQTPTNLTWKDWASLDTTQQTERITARASIEVLYNWLQDVPACRKILEKISDIARTNEDNDYVQRSGQQMPLLEVNDAWGHPIRYRNHGAGNFPVLTSAGPDGLFETADDIISSEF